MGAHMDTPDDFGITPAFWSNYLGINHSTIPLVLTDTLDTSVITVTEQLERVKSVS
jgi:hypothetical protein